MKTTDTQQLLQAYARGHSEAAFQELVNRYVDLVYSAAIRRVDGDTQLAEDVTQEVFTHLARKAASLPPNVTLGGWLHRHTGFVASTAMRGEQRRRNRERQAVEMNALNEPSEAEWNQLGPVLDEAMDELDTADRDALVLRYFEQFELRAVGAALGVSDDTAQKRVSRAVEKLRGLLLKRGRTLLPAAALGMILGSRCVAAAPAGLGPRMARIALDTASVAGGAGLISVLLKLLTPHAMKLLFATVAAVVAIGAWVSYSRHGRTQPPQPLSALSTPMATNLSASLSNAEPPPSVAGPQTVASTPEALGSNVLRLVLVAADSGKPVPGVRIDYRGWHGKRFEGKTLAANRVGVCDVAVSRESLTELGLTTRTGRLCRYPVALAARPRRRNPHELHLAAHPTCGRRRQSH